MTTQFLIVNYLNDNISYLFSQDTTKPQQNGWTNIFLGNNNIIIQKKKVTTTTASEQWQTPILSIINLT